MSHRLQLILSLLLSAILVLTGCSAAQQEEPPTPLPPVSREIEEVSAEGFIVPDQEANLAFEIGGLVVEVLVEEGDFIAAGETLARLDNVDQLNAVLEAEAALASAQASLAETLAGPTPEEIAEAQAAVAEAEASLASLSAGPTAEEIAVAEAAVRTRQAELRELQAGARPQDIAASAAELNSLAAAVRLAQAEYDKVRYDSDNERAQPAGIALQQATLDYQAGQARHQALVNGPTPEQIAILQAQVVQAQRNLEDVRAGPTPEEIAQGQAAVLQAEASLANLLAGATAEEIAISEAAVTEAEAALELARLSLDDTELIAPFSGTVTNLDLEVGQFAEAGIPILSLADLSRWSIETDDLDEIGVVHLEPGQPVVVTIDALPAEEFEGTVRKIARQSEIKGGDVTYTVEIELRDAAATDERLKWGMTTFVEIQVE